MPLPTYSHMCSLIKTQSNECTTLACSACIWISIVYALNATNLRTPCVQTAVSVRSFISTHISTSLHRERVCMRRQSACKHVIYSNLYNSSKRTRGAYYANSFSTRQIGKKATANARASAMWWEYIKCSAVKRRQRQQQRRHSSRQQRHRQRQRRRRLLSRDMRWTNT